MEEGGRDYEKVEEGENAEEKNKKVKEWEENNEKVEEGDEKNEKEEEGEEKNEKGEEKEEEGEEKQGNEGNNEKGVLKAKANKEEEKVLWFEVIQIVGVVEAGARAEDLEHELTDTEKEQAKTKDDYGQMIGRVPESSKKVQKMWELHDGYRLICIRP